MTEKIGSWILSVACCGILVSLVQSLLPKGVWSRIGQFTGGILMILTVAGPLTKFDAEGVKAQLDRLTVRQQAAGEAQTEVSADAAAKLIIREYHAYILEQAEALGVSCRVEVECRETEAGLPIPENVVVTGELEEGEGKALSDWIAEEFGVSVELRGGEE